MGWILSYLLICNKTVCIYFCIYRFSYIKIVDLLVEMIDTDIIVIWMMIVDYNIKLIMINIYINIIIIIIYLINIIIIIIYI